MAINGSADYDEVLTLDFGETDAEIESLNIDLSSFGAVTSAAFRLLAFNSESVGGALDMESLAGQSAGLIVTGEISAVPLPAPAFMLLADLIGLGALRFRRSA